MKGKRTLCLALAAFTTLAASVATWGANVVTLQDQNTFLKIRTSPTDNVGTDTDAKDGLYQWKNGVNGTDQVGQQWFWYRIGDTATDKERRISDLTRSALSVIDGNADGKADAMDVTYTDNKGLTIKLKYQLVAGATGSTESDLRQTVIITNKTGKTLNFHLFQFSDFNLAGTNANDSVAISGYEYPAGGAMRYNKATQTDGNGGALAQELISPNASHWQAGSASSLLAALDNTDSPNSPKTVLKDVLTWGPGDAAWAFQWDWNIANNASVQIGTDNQVTVLPEPATALAWLGISGLFLMRRKHRAILKTA